jgi:hypothetical protein
MDLEQILSRVHPNDWSAVFEISDQFSPKTPESWQAIAGRLGGGLRTYAPEDLAEAHAATCRYFDERGGHPVPALPQPRIPPVTG